MSFNHTTGCFVIFLCKKWTNVKDVGASYGGETDEP